jgi:hypothetical protein
VTERITWIVHEGKRILYNNYEGLGGDEFVGIIKQSEQEVLNSGQTVVYVINNVTDSYMNSESTRAAKDWVKNCNKKGITMVLALVGVSGIRRVIAQAIKRDMYFAKSLEDAKAWLAKQ